MLSEKDIVQGRNYLCRVRNTLGDRLVVLLAGPVLNEGAGRSFFAVGVVFGAVRDGVEVLREIDLEAMARGDDKQHALDLRAMLDQAQSSYCATLASLECAKEHARQALAERGAHGGPETTSAHVDGFVSALEAIADGDPLGPVGDASMAVGECPECGSSLAFGLSAEPGSETTARCTRGTYLESPQRDLCGCECTLRREPDGSISVVESPRWSDEVEAEIERAGS